jgi:hypothetical protein
MSNSGTEVAGYSGTPLAKKLGLKLDMKAAVVNPPWPYAERLGIDAAPDHIGADAALPNGLDFLHIFTPFRENCTGGWPKRGTGSRRTA